MGTVFGQKESTARTPKPCYWCGDSIEPGERYVSWCWVDGRDFERIKCHKDCANAWGELQYPDNQDIPPYEHSRGCHCQRGFCVCEKGGE